MVVWDGDENLGVLELGFEMEEEMVKANLLVK